LTKSDANTGVIRSFSADQQRRRSKRSPESQRAASAALAGLGIFGAAVSTFNPYAGCFASIIGIVANFLYANGQLGSDPVRATLDIIAQNELRGVKLVMDSIERQASTIDSSVVAQRRTALYDRILGMQCHFVRYDDTAFSAVHFTKFATFHLAIIQAVIVAYPNERFWADELEKYVIQYVAFAKHILHRELRRGATKRDGKLRLYGPPCCDIQQWIEKATQQLPTEPTNNRARLIASIAIRNGHWVSFKYFSNYQPDTLHIHQPEVTWLSCWGSGSECTGRSCSGDDNPMERGNQFEYYWKCRGEVFWIHKIDDVGDGMIRACDRVGIKYSNNNGRHYWLSSDHQWFLPYFGNRYFINTKTCPGADASSMRGGRCRAEAWRINALGKPCGTVITDRDWIELVKADGGYCDLNGVSFIIFRADVDRNEFAKDLPCK
jgi:hypothetical protein